LGGGGDGGRGLVAGEVRGGEVDPALLVAGDEQVRDRGGRVAVTFELHGDRARESEARLAGA
jgi:hypothetical protein